MRHNVFHNFIAYEMRSRLQSTHQFGTRMELRAERHDTLMVVVRHGINLALIGEGIGEASVLVPTRCVDRLNSKTSQPKSAIQTQLKGRPKKPIRCNLLK